MRFDSELARQLVSRAPSLLIVLLVVLLGVRAGLLLFDLLAGPPTMSDAVDAPYVPPPTRNVVDVPSILRANLFGQSAPSAGIGEAPATTLTLTLAGVFADTDAKRGFAMIGTSSADIKFYRVGAALPGGALLHSVYVDRVLLERGGAVETLMKPLRAGLPGPPPPPVAASGAATVARVQQVIRSNPGILNQVLTRTPVFTDGKLEGMKVYPGSNAQAFNRLGLKAGDLVTAINGTQLNDGTRSEEVFNSLSSAAEARITVKRNNTQQELHLNLAEIANEAERLAQQPQAGPDDSTGPESAR